MAGLSVYAIGDGKFVRTRQNVGRTKSGLLQRTYVMGRSRTSFQRHDAPERDGARALNAFIHHGHTGDRQGEHNQILPGWREIFVR